MIATRTTPSVAKTQRWRGQKQGILAVFAHPDDEAFLVGGTLARYARDGVPVALFSLTRGEKGNLGSPPYCHQSALAELRQAELVYCCQILGISLLRLGRLPDGHLPQIGIKHLAQLIGLQIQLLQPTIVLTFGPEGLTGHPDHIATSFATTLAFEQVAPTESALFYAGLSEQLVEGLSTRMEGCLESKQLLRLTGISANQIHVSLPIAEVAALKWQALEAHRSQAESFATLTASDRELLGQAEYFRLARLQGVEQIAAGSSAPVHDLFEMQTIASGHHLQAQLKSA